MKSALILAACAALAGCDKPVSCTVVNDPTQAIGSAILYFANSVMG